MPASESGIEGTNKVVFLEGKAAVFDVWTEIIQPPETTALAAAVKSYGGETRNRQGDGLNNNKLV